MFKKHCTRFVCSLHCEDNNSPRGWLLKQINETKYGSEGGLSEAGYAIWIELLSLPNIYL